MPETTHTPTGEYPEPAPVHQLDLQAEAEKLLGQMAGAGRRQAKSLLRESGVSVILMAIEAGEALKEHHADGVVTVHLLQGRARLTAEGKTRDVAAGQLIGFQPGVRHDLQAEERSVVLLTITGGDE